MTPDQIAEVLQMGIEEVEHYKAERDKLQQILGALTYCAKIAQMTTIPDTPAHNAYSEVFQFLKKHEAGNVYAEKLQELQAERDALQARIDGALMPLKSVAGMARHWAKYSGGADKSALGCVVVKAIEILTGEGE